MSIFRIMQNLFSKIFRMEPVPLALEAGPVQPVRIEFEYPPSLNLHLANNSNDNEELHETIRLELQTDANGFTPRHKVFLFAREFVLKKEPLFSENINQLLLDHNQDITLIDNLDRTVLAHINSYILCKDLSDEFLEDAKFIELVEVARAAAIADAKEWNFDETKATSFVSIYDALEIIAERQTA